MIEYDASDAKRTVSESDRPATAAQVRGYKSLLRLLIVLVAVILIVLALWGRMHSNATSTVDQTGAPTSPTEKLP